MNKCKIYALYLPQFHRIKENDEWWGEGFTEWNSVKDAKRLSRYSYQPRVPLEGYYDLSDVNTIRHQAEIAKKYGLDGFAIYHYYSNGRLLLEKPAELLLANKDIDINYFFSWANHDWKRTWYGYGLEVLRKQEYGNQNQIREHYHYLSQFFSDSRYLKIDNKPVIAFYRHLSIPNIKEYYEIWNRLAKEEGYDGLYWIQTIDKLDQRRDENLFDASFDFEPGRIVESRKFRTRRFLNRVGAWLVKKSILKRVGQLYDYKKVAQAIIDNKHTDPKQYYGVFRGWDNTPRHKYMGVVYKNESVEAFQNLFKEQYKKANAENHELLLINAWNEWSEGAYLEADEKYKFEHLEAIRNVVSEK